ncbi:MAG: isochorismate synthase [Ignavibacteriae bacterium]|nr:isochorismate synthase [Ignavibacteriota bacterium]
MRQNIKLFEKELINFFNSSRNLFENNGENTLFSFLFKLDNLEISKFTDSKLLEDKIFFYWRIFSEDEEFLGIDPIYTISANGENRLIETNLQVNKISCNLISNWNKQDFNNIPIFLGGIKFAPNQKSERWKDFNDSDWFVPKILFLKNSNGNFIIYNFCSLNNFSNSEIEIKKSIEFLKNLFIEEREEILPAKIDDPIYSNSFNIWRSQIENALQNIGDGNFAKVVLSREVNFKLNNYPTISYLLDELSAKYPRCYVFTFKKGDSIFIGASPEKLAKFSDGWIEIDALAGSAPRGKNLEEDFNFEQFLLTSEKNLNEQQSVVNFITELIKDISEEIYFNKKPIIRKLPNIQHLWTPIKAKLNNDFKLFDVLLKLHPTPAICGTPWDIAQNYILKVEKHDRGLYTGNIGWFNLNGNGEFAVAIRSALIKEKNLFAYSGCGIVEGSEPQSEFEESEIKLKPILSLFVDEKVYQS